MARKTGSTISQEELYPTSDEPMRGPTPVQGEMDDARMLDLDSEEESPFLRGQKRVPVRRGSLPKRAITRVAWAAAACGVIVVCAIASFALYHYGERSWRFRVESSDDIEVTGLHNVTRSQVLEVMGSAIGRNIFFVPLALSQTALEQIPWVASASVMRFIPNHLKVDIQERTPVAFARIGSKIMLADAEGTLMDLPRGRKYSFPVIVGMNSAEPRSTRLARMRIYNDLVNQLDSTGARYSQELSEVDISDPDDVKIVPASTQEEVTVHLGSSDYLERYQTYISHVQAWRQKFAKLQSVDMRYGGQIIVNPDSEGGSPQAALSPRAVKAAMSAGVKQAALVRREIVHPANPPSAKLSDVKAATEPAPSSRASKASRGKWRPKPRALRGKTHPVTHVASRKPASVSHPAQLAGISKKSKPSPAIPKAQENP